MERQDFALSILQKQVSDSPQIAPANSERLNAAFIIEPESFDAVFGPEERARIASLAQLVSPDSLLGADGFELVHPDRIDVLFTGWSVPCMTRELLDKMPRLKAIFHAGGSVKSFVSDELWQRDIQVSSAALMNAKPVAEFAFSQIIFCLKHGWQRVFETREDRIFRKTDAHMHGANGARVGLLSLGHTGRKVLDFLKLTDVSVLVYDPFVTDAEARELGVERVGLDELFERSHVISCHTPLLAETSGMLRKEHFERMLPGASFINTARGAVVNEPELVEVFRKRSDLYAVLDVTDPEPPAPNAPILDLPNVIITPHIAGSLSFECRRMGRMMVDDFERFLAAQPLLGQVKAEQLSSLA